MEMKRVVARFMVHKVGSFVIKERVLCFGEYGFSTFDRENEQLTNTWAYEDVDGVSALEGETVSAASTIHVSFVVGLICLTAPATRTS